MKAHWLIGIVMAPGLFALPQDCNVYVYVENGVPMPVGMLLDAKAKTTQMFREIGINLRIRNGIPARDPSDVCTAPIVVEFENSTGYRGNPNALAFAAPFKESGTRIHVFLDRVLAHLNHELAFSNTLLAHVMAHEITHVLEQTDRHSDEGLMKTSWTPQDHARMKRRPLPFAPEDVELIHQALAKRVSPPAAE